MFIVGIDFSVLYLSNYYQLDASVSLIFIINYYYSIINYYYFIFRRFCVFNIYNKLLLQTLSQEGSAGGK